MDILLKYFPNLSEKQKQQYVALFSLYEDWNSKINVISRKDIENLYTHHILHSLAIAKFISFKDGSSILDVGTGGGFPGIPLAIMFPKCQFVLLDSIGKKIKVVAEVSSAIGLTNVEPIHARVEQEKRKFDFVVSRATMPMPDLYRLAKKNVSSEQKNPLPNGMICLKGGNLEGELQPFRKIIEEESLSSFFEEDFFETKKIVYLPF